MKKETIEKYEALAKELEAKLQAKDDLANRLARENKELREQALVLLEGLVMRFGENPAESVRTGIAGKQAELIKAIIEATAGKETHYPEPWPAVLWSVQCLRADYDELARRERDRAKPKRYRLRKRRAKKRSRR